MRLGALGAWSWLFVFLCWIIVSFVEQFVFLLISVNSLIDSPIFHQISVLAWSIWWVASCCVPRIAHKWVLFIVSTPLLKCPAEAHGRALLSKPKLLCGENFHQQNCLAKPASRSLHTRQQTTRGAMRQGADMGTKGTYGDLIFVEIVDQILPKFT